MENIFVTLMTRDTPHDLVQFEKFALVFKISYSIITMIPVILKLKPYLKKKNGLSVIVLFCVCVCVCVCEMK